MDAKPDYQLSRCLSLPKYDALKPMRYSALAPGLQAAIGLLEQEIVNETAASDLADGNDKMADAMAHNRNVRAFRLAQALLREQMSRLENTGTEIEP